MNKRFLMLLALVGAFQVSTAMADAPVAEPTAPVATTVDASKEADPEAELAALGVDLDPVLDDEVQKLARMSEEELSKTLTEMMKAFEAEAAPAAAPAA